MKRYKYVGKERDNETGLYYYGARYYSAWLARFISVDPLQHKYPYYTPYQYAGNKPVTFIDLDGLEEIKPYDSPEEFGRKMAIATYATWMEIGFSFKNLMTYALQAFSKYNGAYIYAKVASEQLKDFGYLPKNPSPFIKWGYDIDPKTGELNLKKSRPYIVPKDTPIKEFLGFAADLVSVGLLFTPYKVEGLSGPAILAERSGLAPQTLLSTFKRSGKLGGEIKLLYGNAKKGFEHILKRHSADEFLDATKGDLFPVGTTDDQIINAIEEVYRKGVRTSDLKKTRQVFEKRIKLNGVSDNYRLVVDKEKKEIITFYKIGGDK